MHGRRSLTFPIFNFFIRPSLKMNNSLTTGWHFLDSNPYVSFVELFCLPGNSNAQHFIRLIKLSFFDINWISYSSLAGQGIFLLYFGIILGIYVYIGAQSTM